MQGFNKENINIHDLTVEEPEKQEGPYFDPETEITKDDWEHIEKKLKDMERNHYRWDELPEFGKAIKLLKPDADLNITSGIWRHLENKLQGYGKSDHTKGEIFARYAASMKIINPDFRLTKGNWENLNRALTIEKYNKNAAHIAYLAANMKILDPEFVLDLGQEFWEEVDKTMHGYTTLPIFLEIAHSVKILNPDFNLDLKQENAKGLGELLQERRDGGDWQHFAELAAQAKILTAEEVKVTDQGLEVNMHKPKLKPEPKDLPEQRKF